MLFLKFEQITAEPLHGLGETVVLHEVGVAPDAVHFQFTYGFSGGAVDDFERALAVIDDEGVRLIYNKFIAFLDKNDVHAIETEGVDFNTDEHVAIT